MPIDTFEGGRVFASPERLTRWVSINESRENGCEFITVLITGNNSEATLTIPEAEALVRHLRRAIRRQKARAAQ